MEIKSSFKWAALLPKLEGARMSVDNIETAAKAADAQVKQAQNAVEVPDLTKQLAALAQQKQNIDAAIATQKTQNQSAITPEVSAAIQTLSTPGSSIIQRAFATATLNAASPTLNNLVAQQQNLIATTATLQTRLNAAVDAQLGIGGTQTSKGTTIYAEDLIVSNTGNVLNTDFDYENFNYSVPFRQAYKDQMQQTGTGLVGPYHRDRSTFGSLIEQLYEPYTTQLSNVDLDIRGDPYWIGQSNLQRTIALRLNDPNGGSQNYSPNLPNWMAGDQVFMFTFRYPIVTGNDFVPIFRNDDSFIGIYRATQITSYFSDGIFKQRLHGLLYPLINVINAINNLNNATPSRPSSQNGNTSTPRPANAATAARTRTSPSPSGTPAGPTSGATAVQPQGGLNSKGAYDTLVYTNPDGTTTTVSGGSAAWRNNNPGNIMYGDFAVSQGAIGSNGRFAVFPDVATGTTALTNLLDGSVYQSMSIDDAINHYAPAFENNTTAYQAFVNNSLGVSGSTKLSQLSDSQIQTLQTAIQKQEGYIPGTVRKS